MRGSVSICTFVPVKQVNRVPHRTRGAWYRAHTARAPRCICLGCQYFCTVVLVKRVHCSRANSYSSLALLVQRLCWCTSSRTDVRNKLVCKTGSASLTCRATHTLVIYRHKNIIDTLFSEVGASLLLMPHSWRARFCVCVSLSLTNAA
jgi:hypothetical protein